MKLATLAIDGQTTASIARDDGYAPVKGYEDVGALLRDGERGTDAARAAASAASAVVADPRDLRCPILDPSAVVCVGLNYRTHILEMGRDLPSTPTLFSKLGRALADPYADVELPGASQRVDYEGELAVVIGTRGRNIPSEVAWSHVAGLTVMNDVSMRDFQRRTAQWFAGKTFQASTPVGPWIVTPDELPDIAELELRLAVNAEERQRASLGDLVFDIPTLVADISVIVELQPGDIIATGTPGGVGEPHDRFLRAGDIVTVEIDRVGSIKTLFREAVL